MLRTSIFTLLATISGALGQETTVPADAALRLHAEPRPLAEGARLEDSTGFRGPRRDGHANEAPLAPSFGDGGPRLLWEREVGEGFASPAIAGGLLVHTHRQGGEVHVDGLDAVTGARRWRHSFPCDYSGRYFDDNGPRATPSIAGDRVVVHGTGGRMVCLALESGELFWSRDTTAELRGGDDDFFGVVSSPLVVGDVVVQNVGAVEAPASKSPCVAAFALEDGRTRWTSGPDWGPSCASPILASVGGTERILVLAGGESRPPTGGLVALTPGGKVTGTYDFRSRTALSINGASPVACGDVVYLTAAYNVGSAAVRADEAGALVEVWRERRALALEFSTPVFVDGLVVAVDGVSGKMGELVAVDPTTGDERARLGFSFEQPIDAERSVTTSLGKGSLLHADGVLWVLGDTGRLVTAKLVRDGDEVRFEPISDAALFFASEAWVPPVISHGLLYVRQNTPGRDGSSRRLLCYDVRGE